MRDEKKTKKQLISELMEYRRHIAKIEASESSDKKANKNFDLLSHSKSHVIPDQYILKENQEILNYLKRSRLFSHLPKRIIKQLLPLSKLESYPSGAEILTEGIANTEVFFLIKGSVEVYVGGEKISELRRKGDIFGEMSIISNKSCSASIIAKEPVRVFKINAIHIGNYTDLEANELDNIFYRLFAMILTEKLSLTNRKAQQYETIHKDLLKEIDERKLVEKKLQIAKNTLEKRVEERTFELKSTNERLQREIEVRKQAEAAIKKNEEKFRQVYENMAIGAARVSLEFKIEGANDAYCSMLGYSENELIGKHLKDISHPEILAENLSKQSQLARGEIDHFRMDKRFIHKSGHIIHGILDANLIRDAAGEPLYFIGSVLDISDRKKVEEKLLHSKKKYQDLVENINDTIFSVNPDGDITYISQPIVSIIKYTPDELVGSHFSALIHPDDLTLVQSAFNDVLQNNLHPSEYRIHDKYGEYVWVRTSSKPLYKNDKIIGLQGIVTDISQRKQYEDQLIQSKKEWENIFQAIGHPAMILDSEHDIVRVNQATLKVSGLSENQLIGKKCFDVFHHTDTPPDACPAQALLHKGSMETVEMEMDALGRNFLVSCTPVKYQEGNIEEIIHIATDLSETKKLEAELRHAQKMEAIGTLAGGIAHEFNNMLGIIIGNAELAADDIPEWNPAADCIKEIENASLRAKDVVRKLLGVARKSPSTRKPVKISIIVKEALDLLKKTIPATISIQHNILCTTETILADPTEIHQVLINLFTNSQHAIHEETGVIRVKLEPITLDHLSAERLNGLKPGSYIKLRVEDTGEGIPPENMERILDPYFTTKEVDKGLGMGMAVVNGIIKKHDGAIRIESEVGKGTIVEVFFPLTEAKAEIEFDGSERLPTGTERILLVDDEPSLLKLVTQITKRHGYEVIGRSSGIDALELFRKEPNRFDLVVTDMAMPNMPGDRLAQEMMRICPDIPIIVCTGHSERMDENKARELGVKAFIMKPFSRKDIVKTIRKVLDETKGKTQV